MSDSSVHVPLEALSWPVARRWCRLEDLCVGIWDCPHSTPNLTRVGPLVVRSQDIRSGVFRFHDAAHVSEETYQGRIARAEPRYGDIFYSREGTYFGIAAEMPAGRKVCLGQRMVLIRPNPKKAITTYLRLWLNSPILARHIHGFRDGSVAERLNMPTIRGLPVPSFGLEEQASIAGLLGSLDDKIELNRRMSETLEATAQTVFRDWFVDFGPTRRQMAGATDPVQIMGGLTPDPEKAAPLAPLFPAILAANGLPDGWEERAVGDISVITGGATPSTKAPEYWQGGKHLWATPKDLSKLDGLFVSATERSITDAGLGQIGSGLAPVGSVLLSSRAPIGYLAIADRPVAVNQGFIVVQPTEEFPTAYALFWCRENMDLIKANANGSTFQEISKRNFRPIRVVIPGSETMKFFTEAVGPLLDLIRLHEKQNTTLAAIRDLLLPKLMSGGIRLRDAERAVAEAAA